MNHVCLNRILLQLIHIACVTTNVKAELLRVNAGDVEKMTAVKIVGHVSYAIILTQTILDTLDPDNNRNNNKYFF